MTKNEQIEERNELVDLLEDIEHDWDSYLDRCIEEEEQPELSYEDFHADSILAAGYRKVERGEWKDKRCTKCGENMWYIARGNALATTFYQVKSKFCPECGADMRGEKDESISTDT